MDQSSPISNRPPEQALAPASVREPVLALVNSRFRLAAPEDPAPAGWQDGLGQLFKWLAIDVEFLPAVRSRRLPRIAGWGLAVSAPAPVFAPWIGWSPVAFQHGGIAALPEAQFAASYLLEHPRGAAKGQGGIDLVLMSPHPALCVAEEAGGAPLPSAAMLKAMIRTARDEGRERLAIILHARQRNAVAAQLMAADKALTRHGIELDILTIEEALVSLMSSRAPWDAIIAMPDLRSTVFTLLAEASDVRRAWPMLWLGGDGALRMITSEAPGEGASRLPLDANALVQALALALDRSGAAQAARRLHEGWARLRDSGVITSGRGAGDAPYVNAVPDETFLAMLRSHTAVSKRPQPEWRALRIAFLSNAGSQVPLLRVVS
ncbi:MAG: hypothetical protein O9293_03780 [Porphyrobacter sp.]|nr:hypothetical protein [Porphyrobacter sp.]